MKVFDMKVTRCLTPVFFICVFLFFLPGAVYPLSYELSESDNSEIRTQLKSLIWSPVSDLKAVPRLVYHQKEAFPKVTVDVQHTRESVYILFINNAELGLPVYSRGSYIIKRDKQDGSFVHLKVFYRSDPYFYVRIYPEESGDTVRASMNVYVMDHLVYEHLPVNTPFEKLLTAPFSSILNATADLVDWDLLLSDTDPALYKQSRDVVEAIRSKIPVMRDEEDGAQNSRGDFVYIETLSLQQGPGGFNCSGFAKWVADGIYYPLSGRYLEIEDLKVKHQDVRGNRWSTRWEDARDPYFGLDWTRNIARAVKEARYPGGTYDIESSDIKELPFSPYIEDVGIPLEHLSHNMFALAIRNPGKVYFGSVSVPRGDDPPLLQHVHVLVMIPYFEEQGRFSLAVFERSTENTLENVESRYPGGYIHLVSVPVGSAFTPPSF
ncbi:MAG: hypothetical protein ACLFST_02490 [Spirochaetia bacterium]